MALKFPNAGESLGLDWMIKATSTPENLTCKLYKNDYTPVDASVASDFTVADFTNYVNKTLTRGNWSAVTTVSGKASVTYNDVLTWTCGTTGNTVYGYDLVGATSGTLFCAERFTTPRVLANGDSLNLSITISLSTEA